MKRFILITALAVLAAGFAASAAEPAKSSVTYNSYRGLVMAGYQGWFNAPDDGAGRGWYHYNRRGRFEPGWCTIDFWPEVSEYPVLYKTEFKFEDGTSAYLPSSHDSSTVDTHFRWMKEYGLDGVFMQRFVGEISNPSGNAHFSTVLANAMTSANRHDRAIAVMYDLSGMPRRGPEILLEDIDSIAARHHLFDHKANPSYLYHNGKPLVAVWGIGFNDRRRYGFEEAETIINGLRDRGYSILIGVPTNWRLLEKDTLPDERLHGIILKCDVIMPWFVGRYNEKSYPEYHELIKEDIKWAKRHKVDYAPLCFPGFSWKNMQNRGAQIPRNGGSFFKSQLDYCIKAGAKMLYIAMFDEIDEGTAIFKIARKVPVPAPGSEFVPLEEGLEPDHYLRLAGEAAGKLKKYKPKH